jgi:hypothetical protein
MARSKAQQYLNNGGDIAAMLRLVTTSTAPNQKGTWGINLGETGVWPGTLGSAGDMCLNFTTLVIHGLDQIENVTLLLPYDHVDQHSDVYLGFKKDAHVNFTLGIMFWVKGPHIDLYDEVSLTIAVKDMHLLLNTTIDVNVGELFNSTMKTLFNHPACLVHSLEHWGFPNFTVTTKHTSMGLDCIRCTSPAMVSIKERLSKIKDFTAFTDFLNEGLNNAGKNGKGLLRNVPYWLEYFVWNSTDIPVKSACPASFNEMGQQRWGMPYPLTMEGYAPPSNDSDKANVNLSGVDWPSGINCILYGVLFVDFVLIVAYVIYLVRLKRNAKDYSVDIDYLGPPLCMHPVIPLWTKIFVPTCCVALLILFVSAHTMTGASFDLFLSLAGEEIKIEKFYEFTLSQSIKQALDSASYPLAFLIGVLSGVWPYIKVQLMLFAWLCPPKYFGKIERGKLLNILDMLGKWSQVDLYILVLIMVAFNLRIETPPGMNGVFDIGFFIAKVQLNPKWGLYGFTIAVFGAIACNQIIVWYNRKCIREIRALTEQRRKTVDASYRPEPTERKAALFAHHWETEDGKNFMKYGVCGVVFVTLLILTCFGFFIWGSLAKSLELDYQGIGGEGLAWAHGQGAKNEALSIVSMINLISNQGSDNFYGIKFIQASVYMSTLVTPLVFVTVLMVLWSWRLTVTTQERLLWYAEILKDWSCLDVFVVAYVVTLLEVENLAAFIGWEASYICSLIGEVEHDGERMSCFGLRAHPMYPGIPAIVSSVVLLIIIQTLIMKGTEEAVHDREPEEHFATGHRPSSAFMDLLLQRTKPSPGFLVGRLLPKWIVKVGEVGVDEQGRKRYTSTAGSVENLSTYLRRRVSKVSIPNLLQFRRPSSGDVANPLDKFKKPDMSFKRPKLKGSGSVFTDLGSSGATETLLPLGYEESSEYDTSNVAFTVTEEHRKYSHVQRLSTFEESVGEEVSEADKSGSDDETAEDETVTVADAINKRAELAKRDSLRRSIEEE